MRKVIQILLSLVCVAVLTLQMRAAPVQAQEKIDIFIPITTEWDNPNRIPDVTDPIVSYFKLEGLDDAPMPSQTELTVEGAKELQIGPITFDEADNYYYTLTGKVFGSTREIERTIRISTVYDENDNLHSIVTTYPDLDSAQADAQPKADLLFYMNSSNLATTQYPDPDDNGNNGNNNGNSNGGGNNSGQNNKPDPSGNGTNGSGSGNNNGSGSNSGSKPNQAAPNTGSKKNNNVNTAVESSAPFWMLMAVVSIVFALVLQRSKKRVK